MDTPLLLIHFNRPDVTARQIAALTRVAPSRVWVLCDAPRLDRVGEAARVDAVRRQLENLPWSCQVQRLYRSDNLGCYRNLASGISWFLEEAGAGIILEDDCLPAESFFPFADELLRRYADVPEVHAISGYTHARKPLPMQGSYDFSNYFQCWGWATWARAWKAFDPDLEGWRKKGEWKAIQARVLPSLRSRLYWNWIFNKVASGRRDSWAYRFQLSVWRKKGLVAVPRVNLVSNIGFSADATHTSGSGDGAPVGTGQMNFPLEHPLSLQPSAALDAWFEDRCHSKNLATRLRFLRHKILG